MPSYLWCLSFRPAEGKGYFFPKHRNGIFPYYDINNAMVSEIYVKDNDSHKIVIQLTHILLPNVPLQRIPTVLKYLPPQRIVGVVGFEQTQVFVQALNFQFACDKKILLVNAQLPPMLVLSTSRG